ncbi:hypothetical protein J4212_04095 [Candidatus Woesearchaeota archaeon]|nr:hypothetical protein [Candidatus Woesearchaeota archaeon]
MEVCESYSAAMGFVGTLAKNGHRAGWIVSALYTMYPNAALKPAINPIGFDIIDSSISEKYDLPKIEYSIS